MNLLLFYIHTTAVFRHLGPTVLPAGLPSENPADTEPMSSPGRPLDAVQARTPLPKPMIFFYVSSEGKQASNYTIRCLAPKVPSMHMYTKYGQI